MQAAHRCNELAAGAVAQVVGVAQDDVTVELLELRARQALDAACCFLVGSQPRASEGASAGGSAPADWLCAAVLAPGGPPPTHTQNAHTHPVCRQA